MLIKPWRGARVGLALGFDGILALFLLLQDCAMHSIQLSLTIYPVDAVKELELLSMLGFWLGLGLGLW